MKTWGHTNKWILLTIKMWSYVKSGAVGYKLTQSRMASNWDIVTPAFSSFASYTKDQ